jgi:uncharacterized protein
MIMTAAGNKKALQTAFEELSKGNGKLFVDLWADEFCWTIIGSTAWSKTYRGKDSIRRDLMAPLFAKFATEYTNEATRFIAEDDYVVVESRGHVMTKWGQPYNNT